MGTNTLVTKANGDTVETGDPNQYKTALTGDFVPRNSSGAPVDDSSSLGTATYRWLKAYVKRVFIGAVSSNISLEESGGEFLIKVGGTTRAKVTPTGLDGSYLKAGTLAASKKATPVFDSGTVSSSDITSTSYATIATMDITVTGLRPVFVNIQHNGSGSVSLVQCGNSTNDELYVRLMDGATVIGEYLFATNNFLTTLYIAPSSIFWFFVPSSSGAKTYTIEAKVSSGTSKFSNCVANASEL